MFFQPSHRQFVFPEKIGLPKPEEVEIVSKDGTHLWGWVFAPLPERNAPRGWIVQFHGNAENITTHFLSCVWLIEHGYGLMAFDYRGYGASEGSARQPGVHEDGVAILNYALSRDDQPLFLIGQSLGGALLPRALAEIFATRPEARTRVKTMVIDSSFVSYRGAARSVLSRRWYSGWLQPLTYLLVNEDYSPRDSYAQLAPLPILVTHGDADQVMDYEFGEEVFEVALPPKRFWRVPGARHIEAWHMASFRAKFLNYLATFR